MISDRLSIDIETFADKIDRFIYALDFPNSILRLT